MKKVFMLILLAAVACLNGCKSIEAIEINQEAKVYIKYYKFEQAIEKLNKSLDLYFESPSTHYWLAHCYENVNNISKALWEYELAIKYDPTMELAQKGYIKLLVKQGREEDAIAAADDYFKRLNTTTREYIRLGKDYLDSGEEIFGVKALEYAYAKSESMLANSGEPRNVKPLIVLADYYNYKGNNEKERQYLMMAFEGDCAYPGVAKRLGELGIKVNIPKKQRPRLSPLEQELKNLRAD